MQNRPPEPPGTITVTVALGVPILTLFLSLAGDPAHALSLVHTAGAPTHAETAEIRADPDSTGQKLIAPTTGFEDIGQASGTGAEPPAHAAEQQAPALRSWHLPLVPQASTQPLRGFIRLHNPTSDAAAIELYGHDETGRRSGPLRTTLAPGRTRAYNAYHLEGHQEHSTLDGALHDGHGHWRLVVRSVTPITVRAYARTSASGFASPIHLPATPIKGSDPRAYHVPFLNPGSNPGSRGILRITNPSHRANTVTLQAWDDLGQPAESPVTLTIAPRATVAVSSRNLEAGAGDLLQGRFGDGTGKWRVRVESADHRGLFVLALVATRDGALHNVSR